MATQRAALHTQQQCSQRHGFNRITRRISVEPSNHRHDKETPPTNEEHTSDVSHLSTCSQEVENLKENIEVSHCTLLDTSPFQRYQQGYTHTYLFSCILCKVYRSVVATHIVIRAACCLFAQNAHTTENSNNVSHFNSMSLFLSPSPAAKL